MVMTLNLIPLLIFPFCLIVAAFNDARSMTIPNEVSIILFLGYSIAALVVGVSFTEIGYAYLTSLCVFAVGFAIFAIDPRIFGAGDTKLLMGIAPWFGGMAFLKVLFYIALIGGVIAAALLLLPIVLRRLPALCYRVPMLDRLTTAQSRYAYGIPIAIGALISIPESPIFQAFSNLPR